MKSPLCRRGDNLRVKTRKARVTRHATLSGCRALGCGEFGVAGAVALRGILTCSNGHSSAIGPVRLR